MSGSDWGRHSKSCSKKPLGSMAVSTAWQISRGPATSSSTGVWDVLCHKYKEQKKCWENVIFTIRVLSRLTALLNLSRKKPGLDLCCDLLHHLQAVPRTCSFHKIGRTSIFLLVQSLKLTFIWNVTRPNSRIIWMVYFHQFCFILLGNIVLVKSSCWPW